MDFVFVSHPVAATSINYRFLSKNRWLDLEKTLIERKNEESGAQRLQVTTVV